jgi:probable rRNA maturation factor
MRTVFGADEQSELEVDVLRWVRLARMVLDQERVPEESEMSVLAFPMDDDVAPGGRQPDQGGRGPGSPTEATDPPTVIGDVVVCPQVARRQTDGRGSLDDEVALLVVHGVLHLLNYDHAEDEDSEAMRKRERELLAQFRELEQEEGR